MARYHGRRHSRRHGRRHSGGKSIVYVGAKKSRILGFGFPTLLLVGGAAFLFRKQLAPIFDKIKSAIAKKA